MWLCCLEWLISDANSERPPVWRSLVSTLHRPCANAGWRRRECFLRMTNFNKLTQSASQVRREKRQNPNNRTVGIQADVGKVARQPLNQAWVVRHWQASFTVSTGASAMLHICRRQHFQTHFDSLSSSTYAVRPYLVAFHSFICYFIFLLCRKGGLKMCSLD